MKKVSRIEYCASFEPLQSGMGQDGESKILFLLHDERTVCISPRSLRKRPSWEQGAAHHSRYTQGRYALLELKFVIH